MATDSMLDSLGPLARALHDRNFELLVALRVGAPTSSRHMIEVVRRLRPLSDLPAQAIRKAIEREEIIFRSLAPAQVAHVRRTLAMADAQSWPELARAHLYAFRRTHPHRGEQTCERLTVVGQTLELAKGQLGRWEQASTQTLPVDDQLLAAIDRQRERWAAAGWCEAGSELEILDRVSARDEQMEARILAAEGDALAHEAAVYADWLLAQGDARGLLGSAALSLDAEALTKISRDHFSHLFGPAWKLASENWEQLGWLGPMLVSAKIDRVEGIDDLLLLERLLAAPVSAGLRTLSVSWNDERHPTLVDVLAESSLAANLRSLSLEASIVSLMGVEFERLERLEVLADGVLVAGVSLPSLRWLSLDLRDSIAKLEDGLDHLDAPSLEHLEFGMMLDEHDEQSPARRYGRIAVTLRLPVVARLRALTVRSLPESRPWPAGLAQVLAQLPARHTLERIDLRAARLTPEARAELEAARTSLPELLLDS